MRRSATLTPVLFFLFLGMVACGETNTCAAQRSASCRRGRSHGCAPTPDVAATVAAGVQATVEALASLSPVREAQAQPAAGAAGPTPPAVPTASPEPADSAVQVAASPTPPPLSTSAPSGGATPIPPATPWARPHSYADATAIS